VDTDAEAPVVQIQIFSLYLLAFLPGLTEDMKQVQGCQTAVHGMGALLVGNARHAHIGITNRLDFLDPEFLHDAVVQRNIRVEPADQSHRIKVNCKSGKLHYVGEQYRGMPKDLRMDGFFLDQLIGDVVGQDIQKSFLVTILPFRY